MGEILACSLFLQYMQFQLQLYIEQQQENWNLWPFKRKGTSYRKVLNAFLF